jgi:hypothetical protein
LSKDVLVGIAGTKKAGRSLSDRLNASISQGSRHTSLPKNKVVRQDKIRLNREEIQQIFILKIIEAKN